MSDCGLIREMPSTIRKRIRRDVDYTHHAGLGKIEFEFTAVEEHRRKEKGKGSIGFTLPSSPFSVFQVSCAG
jgi:hypothetical protein